MKRALSLFLAVVCVFTCFSLLACGGGVNDGGDGENGGSSIIDNGGCEHIVTERATYLEVDGVVTKKFYCNECAGDVEQIIAVAGIVDDDNELTSIQEAKDFKNNSTILIKKGSYALMYVTSAKIGTTIVCEDDVTVKTLRFGEDCAEITIENMNFYSPPTESASRLDLNGLVSGLTIKYCTFKGNSQVYAYTKHVDDFLIENCTFTDIYNNSGSGMSLTAILVRDFNNLTVKNCLLENVQYNALQIGYNGGVGDLIITGNTFKNIGSRVIHATTSEPTFCDISGNTFYLNTVGSGSYFNSSGYGIFSIGVNTWESIPPKENYHINPVLAGRIEYNPDVQLSLT